MKQYKMRKFRTDISKKETSIGFQLNKHRDELFSFKTVPDIANSVRKIFTDSSLHSPKANQIMYKLEHENMTYNDAVLYLQNIMFASAGMATY